MLFSHNVANGCIHLPQLWRTKKILLDSSALEYWFSTRSTWHTRMSRYSVRDDSSYHFYWPFAARQKRLRNTALEYKTGVGNSFWLVGLIGNKNWSMRASKVTYEPTWFEFLCKNRHLTVHYLKKKHFKRHFQCFISLKKMFAGHTKVSCPGLVLNLYEVFPSRCIGVFFNDSILFPNEEFGLIFYALFPKNYF